MFDASVRARLSPDKLRAKIAEGELRFTAKNRRLLVDKREHLLTPVLAPWTWYDDDQVDQSWTHWSSDLEEVLTAAKIPFDLKDVKPAPGEADRAAQFEAVKRWFDDDWMRIEPKLRTSIVEGISVFLSLFDDNPRVKHTFCPEKDTYDAAMNADARHGIPLPPIADLIEQGKVIALNFPAALNPPLARALGTMLKQDFQRAVLNRVPQMTAEPDRPWP